MANPLESPIRSASWCDQQNHSERLTTDRVCAEGGRRIRSTCLESAEVLDYLAQMAGKRWATPEVIAGLLIALDDVLNLQVHLCSFGVSTKTTVEAVRRRVRQLTNGAS